jgi:hypothetical protein
MAVVEITEAGKKALADGKIDVKVKRQGVIQHLDLFVKKLPIGRATFTVLFTEKYVDMPEMQHVAAQTGLPVFAANGKVFPTGTGVSDFMGL